MASADVGNYGNRRFEGMINIPFVDDRADIRIAGEWTKRQGYSFNETTDDRIDGRDLWSGRVTVGLKPTENLQMYLVWEHFSEDDDRLRSGKQTCETDYGPGEVGGVPKPIAPVFTASPVTSLRKVVSRYRSIRPTRLKSRSVMRCLMFWVWKRSARATT